MKTVYKVAVLACFVAAATVTQAQHIVRSVPFAYTSPTDNDYVTWFSNGVGYTPVDTFGIGGASLSTPDTISWGNGNPLYCFKIKSEITDTAVVSLSFYYDSTAVVANSFDRAASIWLNPMADWNHYLITSVSHEQRLEMIGYSWTNSPGLSLPLQHAHWYNMKISVQFISGTVSYMYTANAYVYDLGTDGLQPPVLIGMDSGSENGDIIPADTAISVSISGSRAGGATHLDNLYFNALPSADSCEAIVDTTTTGVVNIYDNDIRYQLTGSILRVQTGINNHVIVSDALGRMLHQAVAKSEETLVDLSGLYQGVYLLSVQTATGVKTAKFVLKQ